MKRSIEKLRHEYGHMPLLEEDLLPDPILLIEKWLHDALLAKLMEPNGMTLSTVSSAQRPSSRTVLLKNIDKHGLYFYTHYVSRKAQHLNLCPYAAATFWWREIHRQVNIEGTIKKLTRKQSETYFHKRPRGAQLAALSSIQSAPLASREQLEEIYSRQQKKYRGKSVPCPKNWGGYLLEPERIEFWQGRANRLHDRFLYVKVNNEWIITRLSP